MTSLIKKGLINVGVDKKLNISLPLLHYRIAVHLILDFEHEPQK